MRYRRLDANGDYVFGQGSAEFFVNTPAAVQQAILTRLNLWQGEWFLDLTAGTPYLQQILGFNAEPVYDGAIQNVILNTPGVNSILSYSSNLNTRTRQLSVNAQVSTIYGTTSVVANL